MAGELRFFRVLSILRDGVQVLMHGNPAAPMEPTTVNALPIREFEVSVAPGVEVTLWTWSAVEDFSAVLIECDGYGFIAWKIDKPTSTTDKTPLGTAIAWMKKAVSCFMSETFQINQAIVNTTQANLLNTAFSGAGNDETGRIYQINGKNPASALAAITFKVVVCG